MEHKVTGLFAVYALYTTLGLFGIYVRGRTQLGHTNHSNHCGTCAYPASDAGAMLCTTIAHARPRDSRQTSSKGRFQQRWLHY